MFKDFELINLISKTMVSFVTKDCNNESHQEGLKRICSQLEKVEEECCQQSASELVRAVGDIVHEETMKCVRFLKTGVETIDQSLSLMETVRGLWGCSEVLFFCLSNDVGSSETGTIQFMSKAMDLRPPEELAWGSEQRFRKLLYSIYDNAKEQLTTVVSVLDSMSLTSEQVDSLFQKSSVTIRSALAEQEALVDAVALPERQQKLTKQLLLVSELDLGKPIVRLHSALIPCLELISLLRSHCISERDGLAAQSITGLRSRFKDAVARFGDSLDWFLLVGIERARHLRRRASIHVVQALAKAADKVNSDLQRKVHKANSSVDMVEDNVPKLSTISPFQKKMDLTKLINWSSVNSPLAAMDVFLHNCRFILHSECKKSDPSCLFDNESVRNAVSRESWFSSLKRNDASNVLIIYQKIIPLISNNSTNALDKSVIIRHGQICSIEIGQIMDEYKGLRQISDFRGVPGSGELVHRGQQYVRLIEQELWLVCACTLVSDVSLSLDTLLDACKKRLLTEFQSLKSCLLRLLSLTSSFLERETEGNKTSRLLAAVDADVAKNQCHQLLETVAHTRRKLMEAELFQVQQLSTAKQTALLQSLKDVQDCATLESYCMTLLHQLTVWAESWLSIQLASFTEREVFGTSRSEVKTRLSQLRDGLVNNFSQLLQERV